MSRSYNLPFTARFQNFSGNPDWNVQFNTPHRSLIAHTPEETVNVITDAENAARQGNWAVLAITYEAAPAFDSAFQVNQPAAGSIFAWNAIFSPDQTMIPSPPTSPENRDYQVGDWKPLISREAYDQAIETIHSRIAAGETYQVNYTFPLETEFQGDVKSWFIDLLNFQQAEYCALLNLPDRFLVSASPELFFRRDGDTVVTRPMKGTMERGRFYREDRNRMRELAECCKNRAENVMITDLVRNDMGRIARPGTVSVPALFSVEKLGGLFQMTSTIQAEIKSATSLLEIFRALFPCGSIVGAPKIRTMKIIRELEQRPRLFYTGAIGFLRPGGNCIFNVPIRTVEIDKQLSRARFSTGGGVTAGSTAEGEYEECLMKADFLSRHQPEFKLVETLLLENGQWFLLRRHLSRLRQSAAYFRFLWQKGEIRQALNQLRTQHSEGSWKARLLLGIDGAVETGISPLPEPGPIRPLRLRFASRGIESSNLFLYHKTTQRKIYEQARDERPDCEEVLLWNEKGEITEGCVYNLVVEKDGEKWTPPVASGLLPGVFRAELLGRGVIKERIMKREFAWQADALWLINSVRGWRRATLLE